MPRVIQVLVGLCALCAMPSVMDSEEDNYLFSNTRGEQVSPLRPLQKSAPIVLVFIGTDCPIANSYVPEINRIQKAYSEKGIRFTLVHPDPSLTSEQARQHADEYKLEGDVIVDRRHRLVKLVAATVTPQAVVMNAKGKVVYRGRINDWYAGYGDRRRQVGVHDLRNALDDILAGRNVQIAETNSLGCLIEPFEEKEK